MNVLTRRQFIIGAGASGVFVSIGCDKRSVDAVLNGLIEIGGLVFNIPHYMGKVVGAALVVGGSGLKIFFALSSNRQDEDEIPITEDQGRVISQSLRAGTQFIVTDPTGKREHVPGYLLKRGQENPFLTAFEEGRREALEGR